MSKDMKERYLYTTNKTSRTGNVHMQGQEELVVVDGGSSGKLSGRALAWKSKGPEFDLHWLHCSLMLLAFFRGLYNYGYHSKQLV